MQALADDRIPIEGQEWRPLTVFLRATWGEEGPKPKRDFEELRAYGVVPGSIPYKRIRLGGKPAVLWHPDLERFLRDVARFRPYAHLRGLRRKDHKNSGAGNHYAVLRIFLWGQGWEYPDQLIKDSFAYAVRQLAAFPLRRRRGHRVHSELDRIIELARRATDTVLRKGIVYRDRRDEIRQHLPSLIEWLLGHTDAPLKKMERVSRCLGCNRKIPSGLLRNTEGRCPECNQMLDRCTTCNEWLKPESPWHGRCPKCHQKVVRRRLDQPALETSLSPLYGVIRSMAMNLGTGWEIEESSEWIAVRAMKQVIQDVTPDKLRSLRWWIGQMLIVLFERKIIPTPKFDPTGRIYESDPRTFEEQLVQGNLANSVSYLAAYADVRKLSRYLPLLVAWGLAASQQNRMQIET